jgi:hypothetical protein
MKRSIRERLDQISARYEEVGLLLSEPEVFSDQNRFRELSMEYAQLEPVVLSWKQWQENQSSIEEARQMMQEEDPDLRQMASDELDAANRRCEDLEGELQVLLLPRDPNDSKSIFLEIRAGTGGDEAAIFAGDDRDTQPEPRRTWWIQGNHRAHSRPRGLLALQIRIGHPPRPARTRNRIPGPYPHIGLYRGDPAGS